MPISWKAIDADAGVWGAERLHRSGWHWRSVAVRLTDGSVAVVSPLMNTDDDGHRALADLGGASVLVAPNHFHWMGLAQYRERYQATLVGSPVAAVRIGKKSGLALGPVEALAERLPAHVAVLAPDGLKNGELWLRVATARGIAWVVSDAFFTLPKTPTGGYGAFCRLTGTSPGLRIGTTFKVVGIADRPAYKKWLLARIERDAPRILVPSHGEVLEDDALPARLRALVEQRL